MKNSIKNYLLAYNALAFCFWAAYLIWFCAGGFKLTPTALLLLNIAQGMAFLEIVHALFRWVKSPVGSTAAQVTSRLLVLVVINVLVQGGELSTLAYAGVCIVSFAWSITELVRYSFYFSGLQNRQPAFLLWMRYSFFIVLYPLGVTGEWLILAAPIVAAGTILTIYGAFMAVVAISYIYYFPVLYKYMWKQRATKFSA
ncbi:MAG: protein tyrosine phosphatase-like domain-containing protein [Chitinophagales bacterium]